MNPSTPATTWWPPIAKVRNALAFAVTGDTAAFAGAVTGTLPGGYAAAIAASIVSLGTVIVAFLTSDE